MLSELLNPLRPTTAKLVEELENEGGEANAGGKLRETGNRPKKILEASLDCDVRARQKLADVPSTPDRKLIDECGYGFAWKRLGVLAKFSAGDLDELFEWINAEEMPIECRQEMLANRDEEAFASEHYLYVFCQFINANKGVRTKFKRRLV